MSQISRVENPNNLRSRIVKSSVWLIGSRIAARSIGLISIIILARLLAPEDFGKIAVITAFLSIIELFLTLGAEDYLIHKEDIDDDDFNTVWTIAILRSSVIAILIYVVSLNYTGQAGTQDYSGIGGAIAIIIFIRGWMNTGFLRFAKDVDFSKEFYLNLTTKLAAFICTVSAAYYWRDYRALLLGTAVDATLRVALSYVMSKHRPRLTLSRWRNIFHFSVWLTIGNAVFSLASKFDSIVLSRFLGDAAAGIFMMSRNTAAMPTSELITPVNRVMFSGLSEIQSEQQKFQQLYLNALSLILLIVLPVAFGMALTAPDLVPLVLGAKWLEATPLIQLIAVMMAFQMTSINFAPVLMARGLTKAIMWRSVIYAGIRPALFVVGVMYGGLLGAVLGYCAAGLFLTLIENIILQKVLKFSFIHFYRHFSRVFIGLFVMCAASLAVFFALPTGFDIFSHLLRVVSITAVGATSYSVVILALWHSAGRPNGPEMRFLKLARLDGFIKIGI